MSDQDDKKQQKLNIQIDDDVAQGIYSNLAIINHSQTEFVLDFVNIMPGSPNNKVRSRIILTPQHAKRLLRALSDNINRFEKSQGEIIEHDKPNVPMNFGGPTGEA